MAHARLCSRESEADHPSTRSVAPSGGNISMERKLVGLAGSSDFAGEDVHFQDLAAIAGGHTSLLSSTLVAECG